MGKNALASLSYFYINAGKTAYYLEDLSMAREFFDKAYALYGQFDSFWRRSVLDSYMALTLLRQGEYGQAVKYLTTARENVGYIKDPNDLGVVFFAEAVFRQRCRPGPGGEDRRGRPPARQRGDLFPPGPGAAEHLLQPVRGQAPHPLPADQISRQQTRKRPHPV